MPQGGAKDEHFSCFHSSCQLGLMQDWVFRLELEVDCLSLKNVSKLWRNRSRNLSWPSPFSQLTNYGHTMAKFLIFCSPFQIPIKNRYLGFVCKGLVFRRNNGWIIENTDKGLTVQNWVLIYWPKIFQMAQNFLPKQKVWDWASVQLELIGYLL